MKNILKDINIEDLNKVKKPTSYDDFKFYTFETNDEYLYKVREEVRRKLNSKDRGRREELILTTLTLLKFDMNIFSNVVSYIAWKIENGIDFKSTGNIILMNNSYDSLYCNSSTIFNLVLKNNIPTLIYFLTSEFAEKLKTYPGSIFNKNMRQFSEGFLFSMSIIRDIIQSISNEMGKGTYGMAIPQRLFSNMDNLKKYHVLDNINIPLRIMNTTKYKTIILDKANYKENYMRYFDEIRNIENFIDPIAKLCKVAKRAYGKNGILNKMGSISFVSTALSHSIEVPVVINLEEVVDIKTYRDRDEVYGMFKANSENGEYDKFYDDADSYIKLRIQSSLTDFKDITILCYHLTTGEFKILVLLDKFVEEVGALNIMIKNLVISIVYPIMRMNEIISNLEDNLEDIEINIGIEDEGLQNEKQSGNIEVFRNERHFKVQTVFVKGHIRRYKSGVKAIVCPHLRNYGDTDKRRILSSAFTVISINK